MQMQDNRERFTLRMPTQLYEAIGKQATETGVSLNALILHILWDWVKQNENKSVGGEHNARTNNAAPADRAHGQAQAAGAGKRLHRK